GPGRHPCEHPGRHRPAPAAVGADTRPPRRLLLGARLLDVGEWRLPLACRPLAPASPGLHVHAPGLVPVRPCLAFPLRVSAPGPPSRGDPPIPPPPCPPQSALASAPPRAPPRALALARAPSRPQVGQGAGQARRLFPWPPRENPASWHPAAPSTKLRRAHTRPSPLLGRCLCKPCNESKQPWPRATQRGSGTRLPPLAARQNHGVRFR